MQFATGSYTGDGNDNRNINIGVDLASKANVFVYIKSNALHRAVNRIEYAQGDFTMFVHAAVDMADFIQLFNSTGFQIGTGTNVNENEILFRYIVWWQES